MGAGVATRVPPPPLVCAALLCWCGRSTEQRLGWPRAQPGDPEGLRTALKAWFYRPDQSRPEYYQNEIQRWRAAFRKMALSIDARIDASQRRAILQRLNQVIADLEDLSRR